MSLLLLMMMGRDRDRESRRYFKCYLWACPTCGIRVHSDVPGRTRGSTSVPLFRRRERCSVCVPEYPRLVYLGEHSHLRGGGHPSRRGRS